MIRISLILGVRDDHTSQSVPTSIYCLRASRVVQYRAMEDYMTNGGDDLNHLHSQLILAVTLLWLW